MEFSEQKAGPYIHPTQQTLLSSDPCFAERLKTACHSSDAHDVDMHHGLKFDLCAHHVRRVRSRLRGSRPPLRRGISLAPRAGRTQPGGGAHYASWA
ncbi:hypothetical protein CH63R_01364 [Colletotrichum higginsianum IMI 349063]|uniref:Uncharacterized protein n=1 Tax=Colletotrichum higginsianum (strain IMI 349063) TaxID=759273 RepID=A0A1B7YW62_COLHI|nr:hypothetical protein CH63R_01364 [Colletotrichum higginsianum IMI 349063]OBR16184.1 hypothetical protein CH63R_01364 [Colletotrichum higginsianum IMI 349063]